MKIDRDWNHDASTQQVLDELADAFECASTNIDPKGVRVRVYDDEGGRVYIRHGEREYELQLVEVL